MSKEDRVQGEIIELISWIVPNVVAFAIPNKAMRTPSGKAGNAVPGLRKGVWDIGMILPINCRYPGMTAYCEVKVPPNDLSDDQREFGLILTNLGVPHFIARAPDHLDQVRHALSMWRVHTKEAKP